MKGWSQAERRWAKALLGAMLPGCGDRPAVTELSLDDFWAEFAQAAPPMLRAGFRAAVWWLTWRTLWTSLRPFHRLEPARRDALLQRWGSSRAYLPRQLVMTIKVVSCLAYFSDPGVRRSFGKLP